MGSFAFVLLYVPCYLSLANFFYFSEILNWQQLFRIGAFDFSVFFDIKLSLTERDEMGRYKKKRKMID